MSATHQARVAPHPKCEIDGCANRLSGGAECPAWQCAVARGVALTASPQAAPEVEKLQAFKDYVHQRLDAMGVPVDPDSPHKAAGCRIGGRLDFVEAALASPQAAPANEWADMATNGIQWLRNIKAGISTPDEALAEMESNLQRIRAIASPQAAPEGVATKLRELADLLAMKDDGPKRDRADILRDVMSAAARELRQHAATLDAASPQAQGGEDTDDDSTPAPSCCDIAHARGFADGIKAEQHRARVVAEMTATPQRAPGVDECGECQHRWQPDADVEGAVYCPKCDVTRSARAAAQDQGEGK